MTYRLDRGKTTIFLNKIIKEEIRPIVNRMMERFDKEIIPFEDPEDPAKPSRFRDEFDEFLENTISSNIILESKSVAGGNLEFIITVGVGDAEALGFGEKLDESTTDGLRIIGTIIQGIVGEYVLVTSDMTGGPEGRFGKGFLLPVVQYRKEAPSKGWDPNKPIWSFSNFPGVSDFFDNIDFGKVAASIAKKIGEALK